MEFAQPLLEMAPYPTGDIKKMNEIFGVLPEIWNYTLEPPSQKKEADIISLISRRLKLDENESRDFFNMMVERRHFLFPLDIQPDETPYVFMRKQVCYLIDKLEYESLDLVPEVLGPDARDYTWVASLRAVDLCIKNSVPYDTWERVFFELQDVVSDCFCEWLEAKNAGEHLGDFLFMSEMYFDFIYAVDHEAPLTLENEPGKYVVGFFVDFLLTKTSLPPWKYALAPASLKLFYTFLYEKEYLPERAHLMFEFLDSLEPFYVEFLRDAYS